MVVDVSNIDTILRLEAAGYSWPAIANARMRISNEPAQAIDYCEAIDALEANVAALRAHVGELKAELRDVRQHAARERIALLREAG